MRTLLISLLIAVAAQGRAAKITILATTDVHGNILPWDYLSGKPSDRGLAKIATLIRTERKTAPDALLVDAGDTIQGAPLETVWQGYVSSGKLPLNLSFDGSPLKADPMMTVMNHLRYDAMALGNHEFNYGLKNLERARSEARFPWLSANAKAADRAHPFDASIIKTVNGVRVAIVGVTTPSIPNWEKPENYAGYSFIDPVTALSDAVSKVRPNVDVVLLIAHTGRHSKEMGLPDENQIDRIATSVKGIDAIVYGHTHSEAASLQIDSVLLTQPKNWGMSLSRIDIDLESSPAGKWTIKSKTSRLIPVTAAVEADPEVVNIARPWHELTEKWLNSVIAESPARLAANTARVEDTAIIDAVQQVQMHYAKADVSFAASFNPRAVIAEGPVTIRQIASLYLYDNELYALEGNGRMVREALENAARYYNTSSRTGPPQNLINRNFIGFNYDMAEGVTYDIDVTQPEGQRIKNLKFRGVPLSDDQPLRIAVNNYRAGGSGGYTMFRNARVLWRSFTDIRELIIEYYSHHKLPAKPDFNWKVVPEAARLELLREVQGEASRPLTQ